MSSRTIGPGRRGLVFSPEGIRIGKKKKFGGKDISYPDCFSAGGVSITHQGFIFVAGDPFFFCSRLCCVPDSMFTVLIGLI